MPIPRTFRWALSAGLLIGLAPVSGCGLASSGTTAATPTTQNGRKALEAALDAWKAGKPIGTVPGAEPAVNVVDRDWQAGQQLSSYEILREEPANPERKFAVKLTTSKPTATSKEVFYVIVGNGPSWVFREEDYAQSINMDDGASRPTKGRRANSSGRNQGR